MVELIFATWKCNKCGFISKHKQEEELMLPAICVCGAKTKDFVLLPFKSKWKKTSEVKE